MRTFQPFALVAAVMVGASLAACKGTGQATLGRVPAAKSMGAPAVVPPALVNATRWPYPAATGMRRMVDLAGSGQLNGRVMLSHLDPSRYGQNRAAYQLASTPAAQALVLVSLLDDSLVRVNGQPLEATTDAEGNFELKACMPLDRPLVVTVRLADGLRLSALLPPAQSSVVVSEASTVVLETLRWQMPQSPATPPQLGERVVGDLGATDLANLEGLSEAFLGSRSPSELKALFLSGAGEALRSASVGFLGVGVRAGGTTASDVWSDAWNACLGLRPLALTSFAGTGRRLVYDDRGDEPATGVEVVTPKGMAFYGEDLYLAEEDGHRLTIIPAADRMGWGAQVGRSMKAGAAYALLGPTATEGSDTAGFELRLADVLLPMPIGEMWMADAAGFPMFAPHSVAVEDSGASRPHVAVSSSFAKRVFLLPGQAVTRYNAPLVPTAVAVAVGRGLGALDPDGPVITNPDGGTYRRYTVGDGARSHNAALGEPGALAFDANHNLWLHDAGSYAQGSTLAEADPTASAEDWGAGVVGNVYHGQFRVVRASDGLIFTQRLTHGGQPFRLHQKTAMTIHGGHAYVADPEHHWVFRFALPAGAAVDAWATNPPAIAVAPVLGQHNQADVLDLASLPGGVLPAYQDLWDPLPQAAVRLQAPQALTVAPDGSLWVADAGRLWALAPDALDGVGGTARLVSGGLDRETMTGDAHLAWLPQSSGLAWSPKGLVVGDSAAQVLRLLHVGRGLD